MCFVELFFRVFQKNWIYILGEIIPKSLLKFCEYNIKNAPHSPLQGKNDAFLDIYLRKSGAYKT
jgi:hypothetical protein